MVVTAAELPFNSLPRFYLDGCREILLNTRAEAALSAGCLNSTGKFHV